MNQAQPMHSTLAELPAIVSAAPHRLLLLAGASNVLLAMLWWTA